MSGRVVALLVGIDAYLPPVNPLYGCRNDMLALEEYLVNRVGADLELRTLYDGDASRDHIVAGFRDHVATARTGDVALFAFAGHGSREPPPPEVAHLESTGRTQTLMLYDSGRHIDGTLRRPLAAAELSLLITEVVQGGARAVVILDCGHASGGTRDPYVRARGWLPSDALSPESRDLAQALNQPRSFDEFLPGTLESYGAPAGPYVALSACRSYEIAIEHPVGRVIRGAFSKALEEALELLGPRTTYRGLMATVNGRIERIADQHPELFPLDVGGPADELFLEGRVLPIQSTFSVTRTPVGWEVDAGFTHGLRDPVGDDAFVLGCRAADGSKAGMARVTDVGPIRSVVEPIDWAPADMTYSAAVVDVPLPPVDVVFDPPTEPHVDAAAVADVRSALLRAMDWTPLGGGRSSAIRLLADGGAGSPADALRLRAGVPSPGVLRLARVDGTAATVDTDVSNDAGARVAVARVEHIARWERVRGLGFHPSPLRDAVTIEIFPAEGNEGRRPIDRAALSESGGYVLAYRRAGAIGVYEAPFVFLDVRSTVSFDMYVAVLDLTDRFRCSVLLPTSRFSGGDTLALFDGASIPVTLPAGRPVMPGARARDWIKVIVSDLEFDAAVFELPELDEPWTRVRPRVTTTLERAGVMAATGEPALPIRHLSAAQWSSTTAELVTIVP